MHSYNAAFRGLCIFTHVYTAKTGKRKPGCRKNAQILTFSVYVMAFYRTSLGSIPIVRIGYLYFRVRGALITFFFTDGLSLVA
jgi:hypothetical protein